MMAVRNDHHIQLLRRPDNRRYHPLDTQVMACALAQWRHLLRDAGADYKPTVAGLMNLIEAIYRGWQLTITDTAAVAISADGERFECYQQADTEHALRMVKNKVNRLEGEEVWDQAYENEALR